MRSRYKAIDEGCYFITSSIVELIPVFINEKYFTILVNALKFCQDEKGLKIFYYVIMDNHFHMIISGDNLSGIISSLKRHTAREIIKKLKKDNKGWLLDCFLKYKKTYKHIRTFKIFK